MKLHPRGFIIDERNRTLVINHGSWACDFELDKSKPRVITLRYTDAMIAKYNDLVNYWSDSRFIGSYQTAEYIAKQLINAKQELYRLTRLRDAN